MANGEDGRWGGRGRRTGGGGGVTHVALARLCQVWLSWAGVRPSIACQRRGARVHEDMWGGGTVGGGREGVLAINACHGVTAGPLHCPRRACNEGTERCRVLFFFTCSSYVFAGAILVRSSRLPPRVEGGGGERKRGDMGVTYYCSTARLPHRL